MKIFCEALFVYAIFLSQLDVYTQHGANAQGSGVRSSCNAPEVNMEEPAAVTCHFGVDLNQTHNNFRVYRYNLHGAETRVLDCYWQEKDKLNCKLPEPGYTFDGIVSNQLTLGIKKASLDFIGTYKCAAEPSYPSQIGSCVFSLAAKPVTASTTVSPGDSEQYSSTEKGAEDHNNAIGIGVGVAIGAVVLSLAVVVFCCRDRIKKRLPCLSRSSSKSRETDLEALSDAKRGPNDTVLEPLLASTSDKPPGEMTKTESVDETKTGAEDESEPVKPSATDGKNEQGSGYLELQVPGPGFEERSEKSVTSTPSGPEHDLTEKPDLTSPAKEADKDTFPDDGAHAEVITDPRFERESQGTDPPSNVLGAFKSDQLENTSGGDQKSTDNLPPEAEKEQPAPPLKTGSPAVLTEHDESESRNLLFYQNKIKCEPNGDFIKNIHQHWISDHDHLERHHQYIQWLFPTSEEPTRNRYAQKLYEHESEAIQADYAAFERFLKSYKMMLNFFGLKLVNRATGEVQRTQKAEDRFRHLQDKKHSHNYLRITRILTCLGEMGLEHFKFPLVQRLILETLEGSLSNTAKSCKEYWIPTVFDEKKRKELEELAETLPD